MKQKRDKKKEGRSSHIGNYQRKRKKEKDKRQTTNIFDIIRNIAIHKKINILCVCVCVFSFP